jgi:hypothetical protein
MRLLNWTIGGAVLLGLIKGLQYFSLARNIEFVSKVRIHMADLSGIVFAVDLKIINPTRQKASYTKPYIGLYLNGNLIGTQQPGPEVTEIAAQTTTESTVKITLPYSLSMLGIVQKNPAITVKIVSYLDGQLVETSKAISLAGIAADTLINKAQNHYAGGIQ